ncbi:hypothetical protein NDU88_006915 [Pleurodeles waltl]|uniref:Uncharacterized protein n=1 Tax=Pleurodeles waltl TaxID=8319 RepID=A0AAV7N3T8_PLEWA|nr:hypothetical protein NDU88_006915 [Pleurodeles waltl]
MRARDPAACPSVGAGDPCGSAARRAAGARGRALRERSGVALTTEVPRLGRRGVPPVCLRPRGVAAAPERALLRRRVPRGTAQH